MCTAAHLVQLITAGKDASARMADFVVQMAQKLKDLKHLEEENRSLKREVQKFQVGITLQSVQPIGTEALCNATLGGYGGGKGWSESELGGGEGEHSQDQGAFKTASEAEARLLSRQSLGEKVFSPILFFFFSFLSCRLFWVLTRATPDTPRKARSSSLTCRASKYSILP
jgi:hypothetical protein